ncbi:cytochrome c oxidase subunit 3 [Rhizobium sp. KVB221]|uniref:Cytochrome c oxidase subunit 3 n=1 Tax=Rhizobium setariae TaxID=2801340 RepID=A0A936YQ47_9HYPH|nr:cytochrome c oxidase subunit 3 [Rhizobium setariae]MBL0372169.1 cytochrome c oxidase subunit 3 [Rhizobium setariae]
MSAILIFLAGVALIVVWWMARQRLTSKPWLETGQAGDLPRLQGSPLGAAKIGLGVFLAVVGALFALFISAYLMRMGASDWWGLPLPKVVWVNTAVLVASGAALQWAKIETRSDSRGSVNIALMFAALTAVLFLVGQVFAWWQLTEAGYVLAENPANSFFYLITGLHGLHILGGLVVLGRTIVRAQSGRSPETLALSVDLCAIYWHFMLFVWLVLLALFAGWANDFADLCRGLLS